jgi:hypothetical protein
MILEGVAGANNLAEAMGNESPVLLPRGEVMTNTLSPSTSPHNASWLSSTLNLISLIADLSTFPQRSSLRTPLYQAFL